MRVPIFSFCLVRSPKEKQTLFFSPHKRRDNFTCTQQRQEGCNFRIKNHLVNQRNVAFWKGRSFFLFFFFRGLEGRPLCPLITAGRTLPSSMSPSASQTEPPSPPSLKQPPFLKNTEALPARQSQEAKLAGEDSSPDGQTHPEVPQELQQAGAVVILHLRRAGLCRLPRARFQPPSGGGGSSRPACHAGVKFKAA